MMAPPPPPSPDAITRDEVNALLARYPSLVEAISEAKGSKPGQKTLQQLDAFRYADAPVAFGTHGDGQGDNDNANANANAKDKPTARAMTLDDVKLLVEWKLRHGKFRPTLMSLVSSNPPLVVSTAVSDAMTTYRADPTSSSSYTTTTTTTTNTSTPPPPERTSGPLVERAATAVATLCKLRGVGPATASLLLAVHDPRRVPFFSDELFLWLCAGGNPRSPIKYNAKEYRALIERVVEVTGRLDVSALDLEKVAYVVMKTPEGSGAGSKEPVSKKSASKAEAKVEKPPAKRKSTSKQGDVHAGASSQEASGTRRSKRLKS
ncbi:ribosomal recycling factor [Purpureocillium lavendulum]|uniref:Ribosomal recycling factor n=1 Tax=Purpureocillium lavendulum TaxID=1247861 RepID=A0AB34FV20_9HYPO|nr:ribosomal recycling factor [Purpureocillium lavendulum]